uniref:Uncharacterized protein n=1 Tax=Corethron hystrix TaxID=216773 RepID=A0A7S1BQ87_9STRA|mmetsp:Transcript_3693/g.6844  ORF Transcript_3693/g.6844 Transcript_3693/m.6844 type:complete len:273 (+) Transcript_3693:47-865(+)
MKKKKRTQFEKNDNDVVHRFKEFKDTFDMTPSHQCNSDTNSETSSSLSAHEFVNLKENVDASVYQFKIYDKNRDNTDYCICQDSKFAHQTNNLKENTAMVDEHHPTNLNSKKMDNNFLNKSLSSLTSHSSSDDCDTYSTESFESYVTKNSLNQLSFHTSEMIERIPTDILESKKSKWKCKIQRVKNSNTLSYEEHDEFFDGHIQESLCDNFYHQDGEYEEETYDLHFDANIHEEKFVDHVDHYDSLPKYGNPFKNQTNFSFLSLCIGSFNDI